jgi:hypothetical protein
VRWVHDHRHRQVSEVTKVFTRSLAALAILGTLPLATSAQTGHWVSLASIARADHYVMRWLGPERSVSLSRDGIVIVLRPGSVLYDVNSRQEIADAAPVATDGGDMHVSRNLARRLTALANATDPRDPAAGAAANADVVAGTLVVSARQLKGRHALLVQGSATPNARVTLTLLASIAPDIPTSVLQRADVATDTNGRFAAVVSLAPDYWDGSMLTVVATSGAAVPATTRLVLDGAL